MRSQIVTGYPLYKVFDSGHVYSTYLKRFLKGDVDRYGYLHYQLYNNDGVKHHTAHRLVAIHFIPGDHTLQVNHIDGNKLNNDYRNLEWVTPLGNVLHSMEFLGRDYLGTKNPSAKLNEQTVILIKEDLARGELSQKAIGQKHNISRSAVSMIAINKIWSHINTIQNGTEKKHSQVSDLQKSI